MVGPFKSCKDFLLTNCIFNGLRGHIIMSLNLFFPIFLFDLPENVRKPSFFGVFGGIKRDYWEKRFKGGKNQEVFLIMENQILIIVPIHY